MCEVMGAKCKCRHRGLKTASSRQRDQRVYREVCQVNSMQRQMCVHCTVGLGMGIILIPNKHKGRQRDNCMIKYKIEKTKYKSAWAQLTWGMRRQRGMCTVHCAGSGHSRATFRQWNSAQCNECSALQCKAVDWITFQWIRVQWITLQCSAVHCITFQWITLQCSALNYISEKQHAVQRRGRGGGSRDTPETVDRRGALLTAIMHCVVLHYVLQCIALNCVAFNIYSVLLPIVLGTFYTPLL